MKKIVLFVAAVALLASCGTTKTAEQKEAVRLQYSGQVADSIRAMSFTVDFNYVLPQLTPPHYLTSNYWLSLHGDSVESQLPYFGEAWKSDPANNDRSPLDFTGYATDVVVEEHKNKSVDVAFRTRNRQEQLYYILTVFPTGKATLSVTSSDREKIDFEGELRINTPKP